jgi:hypothetical protein
MDALKRNTPIKAMLIKNGDKSNNLEDSPILPIIHKSKGFETPKAALLDLIEAIKEAEPNILSCDEPEYNDCCKPSIRRKKKYCSECGTGINGIEIKNNEVVVPTEVDQYCLEDYVGGLFNTDRYSSNDPPGDWDEDNQLRFFTELQPSEVLVVYDFVDVIHTLLENDEKEIAQLFKGENQRVVEYIAPDSTDEDETEAVDVLDDEDDIDDEDDC